ncbi:Acetyltransferase (GNAT) family protein [Lishizhenia tianjinensis]|uniref:Acetyltransferase (GNAT) family protein n=1 Tax=Lishizhenia tianjinensis TaxID=477690 RepID=A0A1I7AF05_9FLAO|nr:GNAT family N-acetyltransferase [Lishizhenia tianjinensis]SFT73532.1 Acetyltransferase (GNAT) family protein [Lishizhenia tianjinensis]
MKLNYTQSKTEMMAAYNCLLHLYPSLTLEDYSQMLDNMLPNNYGQVLAYNTENEIIGVCGIWLGTKLWCGKYLELDNVVIAPEYRSSGLGKQITEFTEKIAREKECKIMVLDAYTSNFKAHKFYYNQGFGPKGFHFIKDL